VREARFRRIEVAVALDQGRGNDLHVTSQYHQVDLKLLQLLQQKGFVCCLVGRGQPEERDVVGGSHRAKHLMVGEDHDQLTVQRAALTLGDELLQAVWFSADQNRDALRLPAAVQTNAHVHVNLFADALQA
jgi:hypothetical protein